MARVEAGRIAVTVACSRAAGQVDVALLSLPAQSTAAEAIAACGLGIDGPLRIGIWGKPCAPDDRLRDHDRVEVYRPLLIDPKDARHARQRQQRGRG